MHTLCSFAVTLALFPALCLALCNQWTPITAITVGEYNLCTLFTSPSGNFQLAFADDGSLALTDNAVPPSLLFGTPSVYENVASTLKLKLLSDGTFSVRSTTGRLWNAAPSNIQYPGRPLQSLDWTVEIDETNRAIAVKHGGGTFWASNSGIVYAVEQPLGTELGVNEYINAVEPYDNPSYLLRGLDGEMCVYTGVYPHYTGKAACIPAI